MTEMTHEQVHAEDEIHLPPPSWWPLVLGLGLAILAAGLVLVGGRIAALTQVTSLVLTTLSFPFGEVELKVWHLIAGAGLIVLGIAIGGWVSSNVRERMAGPTYAGDAKMAIWVFLGNEVLFFTGLIAMFLLLRAEATPGVDHALVDSIPLVGLNTFILLTSSLTVVLAHDAAVKGKQLPLRLFLFLTIILGSTFVSLQGVEYRALYAEDLKWTTSGYGTAFFTLTGTHGLHVIIGIIWCIVVFIRALQGGFNEKHYGGVEIFGLYWHFVDIVWILLFTLVYLMHTTAPEAAEPAARLLSLLGLG
jgi:cytochrome c oxidase subunit 3/cytochrome o ubiquinol oxidase subunit 3